MCGVVTIAQTAVLSLPGADARLRTDTTWTATDRGVPIYWLNGARVADDYADFYDGTWENEDKPRNGLGNPRPLAGTAPWNRHRPRRHGVVRRSRVPGVPANLQADGGDAQVTLFWETPENDGGFGDHGLRIPD